VQQHTESMMDFIFFADEKVFIVASAVNEL